MKTILILTLVAIALSLTLNAQGDKPMKEISQKPEILSAEETTELDWTSILTPEQFRILRKAGTERPFSPIYDQFKSQGKGDYYCAGCGQHLFTSHTKFDSHCGWPSFYDPADSDAVEERVDVSHGMKRVEVVCANCKGHLGHVFEGEGFNTPTDQRYCINGSVLVFVPAADDE